MTYFLIFVKILFIYLSYSCLEIFVKLFVILIRLRAFIEMRMYAIQSNLFLL